MLNFINSYATFLVDRSGIDAVLLEMKHQKDDVTRTKETQYEAIRDFAKALKANRKVVMLGMGASHCVNEMFAFQLRKLGKEALAITASEYLYDPFPVDGRLVLLTSQSGESIETVKCLRLLEKSTLFGITLNKESTIGRSTRSIIGFGGSEKAFAGTRSVTLSLAIMACVSAELGIVSPKAIDRALQFRQDNLEAMHSAVDLLCKKEHVIVTGRSLFSALAQLFCLGSEELGGKPIVYNETGQLHHGPLEVLSTETALVVFRQKGILGELAKSFEEIQKKTGCSLVVIDSSGMDPLKNSLTITCPTGDDIASSLAVMETFQALMIAYACGKNEKAGIPRYSSKITVTE